MNPHEDPVRAVASMLEGGPFLWFPTGPRPTTLDATVGAVVQTSGSTGTGKRVVLSREALIAASRASRASLGADLTWHLVLPHHYVAGLMVVVRSLVGERAPITASPDLSDLRPTGGGDAISIVATQLHRALESPDAIRALARFDVVLVGGAALAPELRGRAVAAGVPLKETYGMSETCGGVVWDGHPLPGATVQILPDSLAPPGAGRIALGGSTLCDGYLNDAGTLEGAATRDGLLVTADWGRMEDSLLWVGGRLDDVVISGGINVDLGAVRRAVEALDAEATVVGVEDPEWGTRIVVFATDGTLLDWRDRLAPALSRTALPRQFVRVSALPRTPGGKPDRQALLALAAR
ncbi:MAG: AMP-binding protein [Propionibacteriaceae bacterium]|nr:AMP-binding protein [Propionibacteriaceae bacterium]